MWLLIPAQGTAAGSPRSPTICRLPTGTCGSEWSPDRFLRWAEKIGPDTAQLVEAVLASRRHPQQAYRSYLGILHLGKRYTDERLEAACRRALPVGIRSYKGIKNILDTKLDQLQPKEPTTAAFTTHANIRGQSYYN